MSKVEDIGKRIAGLRKQQNLTQLQLAELLSVSDKAVSKWESGKGMPSIDFLPKLSEILNCTIDYIVKGDDTNLKECMYDADSKERKTFNKLASYVDDKELIQMYEVRWKDVHNFKIGDQFIKTVNKPGVAAIQRCFSIGFARAARFIEFMVEQGILTESKSNEGYSVYKAKDKHVFALLLNLIKDANESGVNILTILQREMNERPAEITSADIDLLLSFCNEKKGK